MQNDSQLGGVAAIVDPDKLEVEDTTAVVDDSVKRAGDLILP